MSARSVCHCGRCSRCLVTKLVWVQGWPSGDLELTGYFWAEMQGTLRRRSVHGNGK